MKLNRKQKKYIKKHIRKKTLSEISSHLQIPQKELESYLIKTNQKQKIIKSTGEDKSSVVIDKIKQRILLFDFKTFFKENWPVLAALALLVFIAYFNALNNGFVSDDINGIVRNKKIGKIPFSLMKPITLIRVFQPMTRLFVYKVFGLSPIAFRLVNIGFHLATVITVYTLVYLLSNRLAAVFAAAITAVHPIMVESVTWISGGGYSMNGFFLMLSFLFYILAVKKKRYIYFSLISFIFALNVSEKAVVFPLVLILFTITYKIRLKNWKKAAAILVIPALFVAFFFLAKLPGRLEWLQTTRYEQKTIINPFIQIPVAISSYLGLIFWPKNLTLYHSELSFSQLEFFLRLTIFISFLGIIIYSFKRSKFISFWLSFFIIGLLPTLTPFGVSSLVAERYVYFGAIGIFVAVALMIERLSRFKMIKNTVLVLFVAIIIGLTARTIIRNHDWKNQDTLWLAAGKTSPSSYQNHNNLGDYYSRHGELKKAVQEFEKAITLKPNYGDAYHNLANTYHQMKKDDLAIANYQKAVSFNPGLWQSYQNLAGIYFDQRKYDRSREMMEKAAAANPKNANILVNLGIVYLKLDKPQKAKEAFQKALQLDPANKRARKALSSL